MCGKRNTIVVSAVNLSAVSTFFEMSSFPELPTQPHIREDSISRMYFALLLPLPTSFAKGASIYEVCTGGGGAWKRTVV